MATAVIEPIRRTLGASRLDVLTAPWAAPLFQDQSAVDQVITVSTPWWLATRGAPLRDRIRAWGSLLPVILKIRRYRYDIGIDLRGDLRHILLFLALGRCNERVSSNRTGGSGLLTRVVAFDASLHEVEKNFAVVKLLGVRDTVHKLQAPPLPDLPRFAREAIASVSGGRGYMTLSLRGTGHSRDLPARSAAALAEGAEKLGIGTVYVGGREDRSLADAIVKASTVPVVVLAGELSLLESLSVISGASAAIAVDSGPMHLAALADTPVVGLFGPSDPATFRPWATRSRIVSSVQPPCGCSQPDCLFTRAGPGACMEDIQPDAILESLVNLLRDEIAQ